MNTRVTCPHCGHNIDVDVEVAASSAQQLDLKLGPMVVKKKLDAFSKESVESPSHARFESNICTRVQKPESNRVEGDLIETVRAIVGEQEWKENERLWRYREKQSHTVLERAVRIFFDLTTTERAIVRNRAGWLTTVYKRELLRLDKGFNAKEARG